MGPDVFMWYKHVVFWIGNTCAVNLSRVEWVGVHMLGKWSSSIMNDPRTWPDMTPLLVSSYWYCNNIQNKQAQPRRLILQQFYNLFFMTLSFFFGYVMSHDKFRERKIQMLPTFYTGHYCIFGTVFFVQGGIVKVCICFKIFNILMRMTCWQTHSNRRRWSPTLNMS